MFLSVFPGMINELIGVTYGSTPPNWYRGKWRDIQAAQSTLDAFLLSTQPGRRAVLCTMRFTTHSHQRRSFEIYFFLVVCDVTGSNSRKHKSA